MEEYRGAWHGDPGLKEEVLLRLKRHRAQDAIAQGYYQLIAEVSGDRALMEQAVAYKGCALGCMLPLQAPTNRALNQIASRDWHRRIEDHFGIPKAVAEAIDNIFERQPDFETAGNFAVSVVEAVPVGADLREIDLSFADIWSVENAEATADDFIEVVAGAPIIGEEA